MSTPTLIEAFYSRIWNDGDLAATRDLLTTQFAFEDRWAWKCEALMPSRIMFVRCAAR
jgi:hypothetical protein